jgi:hypothetical protein
MVEEAVSLTKRLIAPAILAAVFVGLLLYARYYETGPTKKEKAEEAKKPAVLKIKPAEITGVEIDGANGKIVMRKKDGLWRMSKPLDARGDMIAMDSVTGALSGLRAKAKIPGGRINLKDYGLDKPEYAIKVSGGGKGDAAIKIGSKAPVGEGTYVMREGDPAVYIVEDMNLAPFRKTVMELRDRSIVDNMRQPEIKSVTVTAGDRGTACMKRPGRKDKNKAAKDAGGKKTKPLPEWYFKNRETADCEAAKDDLLGELEFTEAMGFVDSPGANPAEYGLDAPEYLLDVEFSKRRPVRLEFGKTDGDKVYVRNAARNEIYEINSAFIQKIDGFRKTASKL